MKRTLYLYTFVAALGGFLFGFDTAVINGAIPFFSEYFGLTDSLKGWAVSSALFGCIIGSLFIGRPGDRFGRRTMLKVLALLFLLSVAGSGVAWNLSVFVFSRFIGGIAIGGVSVLSPMYISEIAPPEQRGRLAITFQLAIVVGILVAFFSDYLLLATGPNNWRWMFIAGVIPASFFYSLLFFVSRSPRWLVQKGRYGEALSVIRTVNPGANAEALIEEIKSSVNSEVLHKNVFLFRPPYLKLVLIGFAVGMFNQFTGINVIMYYATDIFHKAGLSVGSSIGQTVIIGLTNLIFTLIAMRIIDKVGRKKMLLTGSIGMSVFLALFAWANTGSGFSGITMLLMLVGFVGFFAVSQGAVIWVLLAEMFPNNIRSRGSSIGSFSHWFFNGILSYLFPVIAGISNGVAYSFAFYALMTLVSFFFFSKFLVETKGKSLEQLEKQVI
jgi:sugar porter (SP) family MFS transporter